MPRLLTRAVGSFCCSRRRSVNLWEDLLTNPGQNNMFFGVKNLAETTSKPLLPGTGHTRNHLVGAWGNAEGARGDILDQES
jgi:hypothetical protein